MKSAAASRQRRLKLQTAYGNALIAARGYQAADTTAAFVRARELAAGVEDLSERFQFTTDNGPGALCAPI